MVEPAAMDTKTYAAIILYSHKDLELARRLKQLLVERNVSCWFADEDLQLAEGIQTGISRALNQSVFALICIGKHGLGAFQQGEWNTVYTAAQAGKIRAIPIYLGEDSPIGPGTVEDLFLAGLKGCDLRQRLDGNPQLEVLITSLGGAPPAAATPGAAAATATVDRGPAAAPGAGADPLARLADYARTRGLNIFVGPTWPERVMPSAWDVALDMLDELRPLTDSERDALTSAPLMRPEEASLAIALRDGQSDDQLDRIVQRFIAPRSLGEPQAYAEIVQIAQQLAEADRPNARATVFTTNVDLSLERALLRQGVAFTRLVYDLDHKGFRETVYEAATFDREGRAILQRDGKSFVERLEGDLTRDQLKLFHSEFERLGAKANISFADFVRVVERNEMIAGYHETFRAPEILPLETLPGGRPVLVKLLGTHKIPRTCVISYDRFFQMAGIKGILPPALSTALSESASLLVGYNLCEPAFRLLFETILREPFAKAKHDRRYAVLQPLGHGASGWDEIAGVVGSAIAGSYHNGLEMQIVAHPGPAERFLADLRQQLLQPRQDQWGLF
jgi:hypothetical protein